ncbi:MAG: HEAT repeat domain-containing protein [Kofleriaceae bacterium]
MTSAPSRVIFGALILAAIGCASKPSPKPFRPQGTAGMDLPSDVHEFVNMRFIHGVPYDAARRLGPAAIPSLLAVLGDPQAERQWPVAATTVSMIGDPQALDPLIEFIADGQGALSRSQYVAKTNALMGLGYIANTSEDPKALDYLIEGTNPDVWPRRIAWRCPFTTTAEDCQRDLAEVSVLGLALSGRPQARDVLEALKSRGTAQGATKVQRRFGELAEQSLREHARIANGGLSQYYR